MSETVEKKKKAKKWLNDLFRTKLEIEGDTLKDTLESTRQDGEVVRGKSTFYYSRGNLQQEVMARAGAGPRSIDLKDLSITIGCDLPTKLWNEFQEDGVFVQQLYSKVNGITEQIIDEWTKELVAHEELAVENRKTKGNDAFKEASASFDRKCGELSKDFQKIAIAEINNMFTAKVQTHGDYKRYKVKAGAKVVTTTAGLVTSIVALATAATPAAPATLVPALLGIFSAASNLGNQIGDLAQSAEDVEREIQEKIATLEIRYKDKASKSKKAALNVVEFTQGFIETVSGGASGLVVPSLKFLFGKIGQHSSKLDGLETKLHEVGINVNQRLDALEAAEKILNSNKAALTRIMQGGKKRDDIAKAMDAIEKALKIFDKIATDVRRSVETVVPSLHQRVQHGREVNDKLNDALTTVDNNTGTKAQSPLGAGGLGQIFGSLVMIGAGYASPPTEALESITVPVATIMSGVDLIRDYTPDVWDKMLE